MFSSRAIFKLISANRLQAKFSREAKSHGRPLYHVSRATTDTLKSEGTTQYLCTRQPFRITALHLTVVWLISRSDTFRAVELRRRLECCRSG